jgi:hypothetical protein
VIFDVVVAHDDPERTFKDVEKVAQEALNAMNENYVAVINRDLDYIDSRIENGSFAEYIDGVSRYD